MKHKDNATMLSSNVMYDYIRKANGLRGKQRITDWWGGNRDEWVFDSNARGECGETLTFHYANDAELVRDLERAIGCARMGDCVRYADGMFCICWKEVAA